MAEAARMALEGPRVVEDGAIKNEEGKVSVMPPSPPDMHRNLLAACTETKSAAALPKPEVDAISVAETTASDGCDDDMPDLPCLPID